MTTPRIPTFEPKSFIAGETLKWTRSFSDYPASDGWTLKYALRGPGAVIDITASTASNGQDYAITFQSLVAQIAGKYLWQSWVEKGSEKYFLDSGSITCLIQLSAQTTFDGRSTAQKIVEAIDAMGLEKATLDQLSYEIGSALGNRKLMRYTPEQIIILRDKYARILAREKLAEKVAQGGDLIGNINVRF